MDAPPGKFRVLPRPRGALALALVVLACLGLEAAGDPARVALRYERGSVAAGEWWRLLGCHLVHYDGAHLALNLAGLALLWLLYSGDLAPRAAAAVALGAALAVGVGLYVFAPAVGWYLGLSGLLHGVWAAAGVAVARRSRLEAAGTLAVLAARLAYEHAGGSLAQHVGVLMPVVPVAHVFGAVGGLAVALGLGLWRARV
jgi:rhomboid family GlyGly-CTERM serine protease